MKSALTCALLCTQELVEVRKVTQNLDKICSDICIFLIKDMLKNNFRVAVCFVIEIEFEIELQASLNPTRFSK